MEASPLIGLAPPEMSSVAAGCCLHPCDAPMPAAMLIAATANNGSIAALVIDAEAVAMTTMLVLGRIGGPPTKPVAELT